MERLNNIKTPSNNVILFLQGVFKKDCKRLEDMFQDKLMIDNTKQQDFKQYDKIPVNFTNMEKWLKSTNILCWYCHRIFKNYPWFEPQSIEPSNNDLIVKKITKDDIKKKHLNISVHGLFCSCNCVRAYIEVYTKDLAIKLNKIAMLKYLYELMTGCTISDIQPSPSPYEMVQYGGNLTSLEYQQKIDNLGVMYQRELEDNNFISICNLYMKKNR